MPRTPEATAVVRDLRHAELRDLGEMLDRLSDTPRSRPWRRTASWCSTAFVGGLIGFMFPAFDDSANYPDWLIPAYLFILGALLVAAIVGWRAGRGMDAERATSLADVKRAVKKMLDSYENAPS